MKLELSIDTFDMAGDLADLLEQIDDFPALIKELSTGNPPNLTEASWFIGAVEQKLQSWISID